MAAPYIRRESSPFLKRVLIPFWVLRVLVLLIGLLTWGFTFGALVALSADSDLKEAHRTSLALRTVMAISGVIVGILLICLIIEIAMIVKRGRRTLSPAWFLGSNIFQFTIILIMFILSVIGAQSGATVGIAVIILYVFRPYYRALRRPGSLAVF